MDETREAMMRNVATGYKESLLRMLAALSKLGEGYYYELMRIRNEPRFTERFSPDEIIGINQTERSLPVTIVRIREISEYVASLDFSEKAPNQELKDAIDSIRAWSDAVQQFMDSVRQRMPKKSQISELLRDPAGYLATCFKLLRQKRELKKKTKLWNEKNKQ